MQDFRKDLFTLARLCRSGQFLNIQGHAFYYEIHGEGEPLLLFHGGLSTIDTFRFQIPEFARHYQVIAIERPGNGHTADIEGSYCYERMADDMLSCMDALNVKSARMLGYSDGANLLFFMALKAPERIEKFVSVGGNFHHLGCVEDFQEMLRELPRDSFGEGVDRNYEKYSPDTREHFPEIFYKTRQLWLTQPELKNSDLNKIEVPVLVMAGDQDVITAEHTLEMFNALPYGELCIFPHTSHSLLKERATEANSLILDFFSRTHHDEE